MLVQTFVVKLEFTIPVFFFSAEQPFNENYSTLDFPTHTNTVISHAVAYPSRWLPKPSRGAQGPEEMCLSLEHQNSSKTSEKMGYFDRVTVSLHIL